MDYLNEKEVAETMTAFDKQTFTNWKLFLPAIDHNKDEPKQIKRDIYTMRAYSNRVHNIEKTVAKYCPHKGYAVLLNKGDKFVSVDALS